MLLFPYHFHKGEQLFIDFLLSSLVAKPFQDGVRGRICTFNKSWTPLTRVAKFKMVELLLLKMHLFTSVGIPKHHWPGRVAQSVGHLTRKSGVLGSIPGLATYIRFSFRFFKKGSCQLLAKVCARSTG